MNSNSKKLLSDIVAALVALVLLVAASLKLAQLTDLKWFMAASKSSLLLGQAGICIDLLFAALLLSGLFRRKVLMLTGGLFALFAYSNLAFLWAHQNCGCFGKWTPDSFTMIVFDSLLAIVIFGLGLYYSVESVFNSAKAYWTLAIAMVAMLGCFFYHNQFSPAKYLADGTGFGAASDTGDIMLLKPEDWVGKPFELKNYILPSETELSGTFVLVNLNVARTTPHSSETGITIALFSKATDRDKYFSAASWN